MTVLIQRLHALIEEHGARDIDAGPGVGGSVGAVQGCQSGPGIVVGRGDTVLPGGPLEKPPRDEDLQNRVGVQARDPGQLRGRGLNILLGHRDGAGLPVHVRVGPDEGPAGARGAPREHPSEESHGGGCGEEARGTRKNTGHGELPVRPATDTCTSSARPGLRGDPAVRGHVRPWYPDRPRFRRPTRRVGPLRASPTTTAPDSRGNAGLVRTCPTRSARHPGAPPPDRSRCRTGPRSASTRALNTFVT